MSTAPTKQLANDVLELVRNKYNCRSEDNGPRLIMDFDWYNDQGWPTIVWEGGPYEWAVECSFELLDSVPRPVWFEAATAWALSIYLN